MKRCRWPRGPDLHGGGEHPHIVFTQNAPIICMSDQEMFHGVSLFTFM